MLVRVMKSQTNVRQEYFLEQNGLRFDRLSNGRYAVLRKSRSFDGQLIWHPIGYTFCEGSYHIFVSYKKRSPEHWFFGITRCDAISGFLSAEAGDK